MSEQFSIYRCNECDCMVEIIKPGNDAPLAAAKQWRPCNTILTKQA